MSLFNIKDKLYKKDQEENLSEHELTAYNPKASEAGLNIPQENDLWLEKTGGLALEEKRKITKGLLALIVILSIILLMAISFEVHQAAFNSANTHLVITGPTQVNSGQAVTYEVNYKNDNWIGMRNAVIELNYPAEFKPEPNANFKAINPTSGTYAIGSVGVHSEGKIIFSGKAYSPKGALIYLRAKVDYQPAIFPGHFSAKTQLGIDVVPAPIALEVQGPQNVVSGNALDYLINYRNNGQVALDNLQVKVQYPDGFKFYLAEPVASTEDNGSWQIGSLPPGGSGSINIRGQLNGPDGMNRIVSASVGTTNNGEFVSYNNETSNTAITYSPLAISQTVNEQQQLNVDAGESLQFRVFYRNNGNIGLRNVILTEKLDSPALDYTSLDVLGGSFDAANNLLTWKAADVPAFNSLAPGASGEIRFSIKVKKNIPLDGAQKRNFVVMSLARIDSPDVPTPISMNKVIPSNRLDMKLNSKLVLETKGFYNDKSIPNSGPMPPRVGQKTTYTIHWKVINVSNDINGATVTASLPTNATMTGKIFPIDARISYNQRTNLVTWNIGKMDAGDGVLSAPLEADFQVGITPSPNQFHREVGLVGASTLSAKDLFTGANLTVANDVKTINLPEDSSTGRADGNVVAN